MTSPVEIQADALLVTMCERANGDLRAVIVALSSRISLADIAGESFEQALSRAVSNLFERRLPPLALPAPSA